LAKISETRERISHFDRLLRLGASTCRLALAEDLGAFAGLLGDTRWHPLRTEDARAAFQEALEIEEKLAAQFPADAEYLAHTADLRNNLAIFLTNRRRHQDAEAVFRQALSEREALVSRNPNLPDYQARLGVAMSNLAESLSNQGKYVEASDLAKRAITHNQAALKASQEHPTYRVWLRNGYVMLAETLLSLGDSGKASQAAEAAIQVLPEDRDSFLSVARAWARCVPRLEKLPKLDESQRRALALSFGDRAVGLLRTAIKKGYVTTPKSLQDDPDFQSLRPFKSFQRLFQEFDGRSDPSKGD
jgi:tetratricopeptide (TPR) repeat protein